MNNFDLAFETLTAARRYFNAINQTYVCFFIYNREDGLYEVICQDTFDHYDQEFNLDYELIDMYA